MMHVEASGVPMLAGRHMSGAPRSTAALLSALLQIPWPQGAREHTAQATCMRKPELTAVQVIPCLSVVPCVTGLMTAA